MNSIEIIDGTRPHVDAAAQVWASATAARDGDATPPPPEEARPLIQQVVGAPGGILLAASTATETVGFVAAEPRGSGCPNDEAEVRYLVVAPNAWGERIGSRLAQALPEHLATSGFTRATLTVYTDNEPAVRLYRGHGWSPVGAPSPHPNTAKPEQRYNLEL